MPLRKGIGVCPRNTGVNLKELQIAKAEMILTANKIQYWIFNSEKTINIHESTVIKYKVKLLSKWGKGTTLSYRRNSTIKCRKVIWQTPSSLLKSSNKCSRQDPKMDAKIGE